MNSVTLSRRDSALSELHERLGDLELDPPAAIARRGRARPIGRQLERGQARERRAPVGDQLFEHRALQPLALPLREVGVLHRQRRQRRGLARPIRGVQRRELARQHACRPAVGDDVVQTYQQPMLGRRETEQGARE